VVEVETVVSVTARLTSQLPEAGRVYDRLGVLVVRVTGVQRIARINERPRVTQRCPWSSLSGAAVTEKVHR